MAVATATGIILLAGTITFANEWYQTKQINWRVPVATTFAALIFEGIAHVNNNAATGLAWMALLVAMLTKFNGKSVAGTLADLFNQKKPPQRKTVRVG